MADIFGGPTIQDLAELWESQPVYTVTLPIGGCGCGTACQGKTNCVMGLPSRTAPDAPKDPDKHAPNHYAAAWQCPGCGTWYSYFVSSCGCQRRVSFVSSDNTNGYVAGDTSNA